MLEKIQSQSLGSVGKVGEKLRDQYMPIPEKDTQRNLKT